MDAAAWATRSILAASRAGAGDFDQALRLAEASSAYIRDHDPVGHPTALWWQTEVSLRRGDEAGARSLVIDQLRIAAEKDIRVLGFTPIAVLAFIDARTGRYERAVRLLGAHARGLKDNGEVATGLELRCLDDARALALDSMAAEEFEHAWEKGQSMSARRDG